MTIKIGHVKADGTSSIVPREVYDMASIGESIVDPELEKKLSDLLDTSLVKETDAKFKLELFFAAGPRRNTPVRGMISAWTNGGFLNGGGDMIVYFCPTVKDNKQTCLNPIDVQFQTKNQVVCSKCRRISPTMDLIGQLLVTAEMQHWATLATRFFYLLGSSADIRANVARHSLSDAVSKETEKNRGGEVYAKFHGTHERVTLTLASLIRDTANGASLEGRIRAFLEA